MRLVAAADEHRRLSQIEALPDTRVFGELFAMSADEIAELAASGVIG